MRSDCDICGGQGKIRLPVIRRPDVSAYRASSISIKATLDDSSREYTCPECSDVADDNRVMVAWAQETYPAHYAKEPSFEQHLRRSLAPALASLLIRDGFVRFVEGPEDKNRMEKSLRAYVGVVAVGAAKRIEARINERQFEVAEKVIQEAAKQISIWGSHYTGDEGHIRKGQAVQEMRDALNALRKAEAA